MSGMGQQTSLPLCGGLFWRFVSLTQTGTPCAQYLGVPWAEPRDPRIALPGTHTLKTWGEDGTKVVIGVGLVRSVSAVLGGSIFNVAWPFSRLTVV